jgi:hypothetical protein
VTHTCLPLCAANICQQRLGKQAVRVSVPLGSGFVMTFGFVSMLSYRCCKLSTDINHCLLCAVCSMCCWLQREDPWHHTWHQHASKQAQLTVGASVWCW